MNSAAEIVLEPADLASSRTYPGEAAQRPDTFSITRRMPAGTVVRNFDAVPSMAAMLAAGTLIVRTGVRKVTWPGPSRSLTRPTIGMDCAVVLVTTTDCAAAVAENAGVEASRLTVNRAASPKRLARMFFVIVISPCFLFGLFALTSKGAEN